jgi:multidrug resistance efflux pump
MRISNLSSMEVNVDVNENDINSVKVGDNATIEVDAFADKKFRGIVTEIASSSKDIGTATSSVDQVTNFVVKSVSLPNLIETSQAVLKIFLLRSGRACLLQLI